MHQKFNTFFHRRYLFLLPATSSWRRQQESKTTSSLARGKKEQVTRRSPPYQAPIGGYPSPHHCPSCQGLLWSLEKHRHRASIFGPLAHLNVRLLSSPLLHTIIKSNKGLDTMVLLEEMAEGKLQDAIKEPSLISLPCWLLPLWRTEFYQCYKLLPSHPALQGSKQDITLVGNKVSLLAESNQPAHEVAFDSCCVRQNEVTSNRKRNGCEKCCFW